MQKKAMRCIFPLLALALWLQAVFIVPAAHAGIREDYIAEISSSGQTALVVEKSRKRVTLFLNGKNFKSYICVGGVNPDGDKQQRGDNRTPEGRFFITEKEPLDNHPYLGRKWLGLSYPSIKHAEKGLQKDLITYEQYQSIVRANTQQYLPLQYTDLGGAVGIHGGNDFLTRDGINWTEGCVALRDNDLDEVYELVSYGTPVYIVQ